MKHLRWPPVSVVLVALLLSTTSGCAWLREATGIGEEADPPPVDEIEIDREPAPADSARATDDEVVVDPVPVFPEPTLPDRTVDAPEESVETEQAPVIEDPVVPEPDEAMAESVPDSQHVVDPDPPLRVRISDSERDELLGAIEADLELARETSASQPDLESLETADRQRWETLAHYVQRTVAFLEADDLRSARDLALKARLLALELRPR